MELIGEKSQKTTVGIQLNEEYRKKETDNHNKEVRDLEKRIEVERKDVKRR